jgi:DNA-binding XRE family transcriptional regulator
MSERLGNYIRTYRQRAGLSQRELAKVLGYDDEGPVSRHERLRSLPPLLIAIAYSVIFRIPVSELFAGLSDAVEQTVEGRLSQMEIELRRSPQPSSVIKSRKLDWLSTRRNSKPITER